MEYVRSVARDFPTGDHAVLHLESRSGSVIVQGGAGDGVRVEAEIHMWTDVSSDADEAASLVAQGMEQDGSRVIVRAPALSEAAGGGWSLLRFAMRSRVDYVVRVPLHSAVRVLSRSGAVNVGRVEGRVHCEVLSGKCAVEDVKGDVTVISRSGAVTVERVQGNVAGEARSGRISVRRVTGNAEVEARSGAVEVAEVSGNVRASARSGSVSIDDVGGGLQVRSRCGSMRYRGKVLADFDVEVHTGPIHLAVDPEHPFFVDAESRVGSVRSELPPRRGSGAPPDGGPKVRLRTRTGSIRLSKRD